MAGRRRTPRSRMRFARAVRDQAAKRRSAPSRPDGHPQQVRPDELGAAEERGGQRGQLLSEAGEEGDEVRDHSEEEVGGGAEQRGEQEGGIDHGGGQARPGLHRDAHGVREPDDHAREVAAGLAGLEARRIDGREEGIAGDGGAHRHAGLDLGEDVLDRLPQGRVLHALDHDAERLGERQPGVQQRGQLLVEEQHLAASDRTPAPEGRSSLEEAAERGERGQAPDREDVQSLLPWSSWRAASASRAVSRSRRRSPAGSPTWHRNSGISFSAW